MINTKFKLILWISLQNFMEILIQFTLLYYVYEVYYANLGYPQGCSNLEFGNTVIGGEYGKFLFWSLPTYYINIKWFKPLEEVSIFPLIKRNMIVSLCVHLFLTWRSNGKYIRCSDTLANNIIHILEILLAGALAFAIMSIYKKIKKV